MGGSDSGTVLLTLPDDGFGADGSGPDGGEEGEEDEDVDPAEVQRRTARLEREQWLREQVGSDPPQQNRAQRVVNGALLLRRSRRSRKEKIWKQKTPQTRTAAS